MSLNKASIIGRLGADPEIKVTESGITIANFNMATTEFWKDKSSGETKDKTEWHRVVVFGKLADLTNRYLTKGREAYVEGKLQTRSWDDKDGVKRYTTEIVAQNIQFIGAKRNNTEEIPASEMNKHVAENSVTTDDMPF